MGNAQVKILAIDDNMENLISLKELILEEFPEAIVLKAFSGKHGLELAATENPNLILLTAIMPKMDGAEVCKKLKVDNKLKDIPVVFITAPEDRKSRIEGLKCGGEGFLSTPIDISELIAQIRAMLKINAANIAKRNENERLEIVIAERTVKLENELSRLRQTEVALKKSEERFKGVFNSFIDVFIRTNKDGIVEMVSPSVYNLFGFTQEEVLGTLAESQYVNPLDRDTLISAINEKGICKDFEVPICTKNGEIRYFSINAKPYCDENGEISGIESVVRDISDRRKAELIIKQSILNLKESERKLQKQHAAFRKLTKELSEKNSLLSVSEERFKKLFEQSPISLIEEDFSEVKQLLDRKKAETSDLKTFFDKNPDFVIECASKIEIIKVNQNTLKLLGVNSKEELVSHLRKTNTYKSFEVLKREFLSLHAGEKEFSDEIEFIRTDGEVITTLIQSALVDNFGKAIVSLIDITAMKNAKNELIISKEKVEESNRLKAEFLNNMSHEIRTPMNGILGFSKLLTSTELDSVKRLKYIKIIQNSGYQLLKIIDDILEISKLGTSRAEAIEEKICLNDLLLKQFSFYDRAAKENKTPLYLEKALSDEKSFIFSDASKLNKIVSNLLDNALKFTYEGHIKFGYVLKNKKIEIFVKDTGIGIKKEQLKIIFDRFSQAEKELSKKARGLGLGLSIAKENAELLGGEINVESELMNGTTFRVTIPHKPAYFEGEAEIKNVDKKELFTILIAEDEEVNFMFIEILLLEKLKLPCKVKVLHATNGQAAVEFCKSDPTIDMILMDLKMPVMNGYQATKLIREFSPDLPIIAQTAYISPEDKIKALDVGCNDFISKPISKEMLYNSVKPFLY